MDNIFLSKDNYQLLYDISKTTIQSRYDYDIDNQHNVDYHGKLFTIMQQINDDKDKFNIPNGLPLNEKVKQLNKFTLDFIIPHFSQLVEHDKNKPQTNKPQANKVNQRSEFTRMVEEKPINTDTAFHNMSNPSNVSALNNKPKNIDFSLPLDNSDFSMDKYTILQEARDKELKELAELREKMNHEQPKATQEFKETITKSGVEANQGMSGIAAKLVEFDEKTNIKKDRDRKFENRLAELAKERNVVFEISQKNPNAASVEPYSGADSVTQIKSFTTEKTILEKRDEGIFFEKNEQTTDPTQLHKQDPRVESILLKKSTNDITRDISMLKQPVETTLNTEFITIDSRDDTNYSTKSTFSSEFSVNFPWKRFKNIKNIEIISASVPKDQNIIDEPYLLVSIKEIGGSLYNSNNKQVKYLTKIYNPSNQIPTTDYIYYKSDPIHKKYEIHDLSSLEKMTVRVTDYKNTVIEGLTGHFSFTFKIDYTVSNAAVIESNMI